MSQLRLAKAMDLAAFPGCLSVVDDTPVIAQCQETQINETAGETTAAEYTLEETAKFIGINLTAKVCTISAPPGNVGDYAILSNTDDILTLVQPVPETSALNAYIVHDTAQAYLTRNEASFARFVENLGNAHTTINGQLYTDVATGPLANACTDTYAPD